MVVTGNGGPSGTGKKPAGEPVLPPPVFVQDLPQPSPATSTTATTASTKAATGGSNAATQPSSTMVRNTSWSSTASDRKASSHDLDSPVIGPVSEDATASSSIASSSEISALPRSASVSQSNSTSDSYEESKKPVTASETSVADSQSNSSQPVNGGIAAVGSSDGLSPADMLYPLQRLASGARSESLRHQVAASAFNGLGSSTVFPVPVSSLSISVWSVILTNSGNSLEVNPYEKLLVPISELMDLTLPPVDAVGNQPWPRPLAYYRRGIDPVLQNNVPAAMMKSPSPTPYSGLPPQTPTIGMNNSNLAQAQAQAQAQANRMDALQRQQLQRQQQELFLRNQQLRHEQASASMNGVGMPINGQSANGLYGNAINPMMNPNQGLSQQNPGAGPGLQNISALQQMFPAVKLNYGAPGSSAAALPK
jgi:hypothetical protein